jgi:hypothetical protein
MLISRLTLSMNTSLSYVSKHINNPSGMVSTYNSSKHRIGDPMASHRARSKQIVEKDFSPPDNVLVCLPAALTFVMSGST